MPQIIVVEGDVPDGTKMNEDGFLLKRTSCARELFKTMCFANTHEPNGRLAIYLPTGAREAIQASILPAPPSYTASDSYVFIVLSPAAFGLHPHCALVWYNKVVKSVDTDAEGRRKALSKIITNLVADAKQAAGGSAAARTAVKAEAKAAAFAAPTASAAPAAAEAAAPTALKAEAPAAPVAPAAAEAAAPTALKAGAPAAPVGPAAAEAAAPAATAAPATTAAAEGAPAAVKAAPAAAAPSTTATTSTASAASPAKVFVGKRADLTRIVPDPALGSEPLHLDQIGVEDHSLADCDSLCLPQVDRAVSQAIREVGLCTSEEQVSTLVQVLTARLTAGPAYSASSVPHSAYGAAARTIGVTATGDTPVAADQLIRLGQANPLIESAAGGPIYQDRLGDSSADCQPVIPPEAGEMRCEEPATEGMGMAVCHEELDYVDTDDRTVDSVELEVVDRKMGVPRFERELAPTHSASQMRNFRVDDVPVTQVELQHELEAFYLSCDVDTTCCTGLWAEHRALLVRYTGRNAVEGVQPGDIACAAICTHERRLQRRLPPPVLIAELIPCATCLYADGTIHEWYPRRSTTIMWMSLLGTIMYAICPMQPQLTIASLLGCHPCHRYRGAIQAAQIGCLHAGVPQNAGMSVRL